MSNAAIREQSEMGVTSVRRSGADDESASRFSAIGAVNRWSVGDVVDFYPALGIPHFQRGLVWDSGNVALLLESLYFGNPCGSVLLWEPMSNVRELASDTTAPYLIIDGQQRIRSVFEVFAARTADEAWEDVLGDGGNAEADEGRTTSSVWCLNLGQVAELKSQFPGGQRFGLFRRAIDPREYGSDKSRRGVPQRDIDALLPLRWFLDRSNEDIRDLVTNGPDGAVKSAALAVLNIPAVCERVRGMRSKAVFHVSVLETTVTLSDAVGIYNRINSAGRRVEAEERAFASLVAASGSGEVERALRDFFAAVHGSHDIRRDDCLARERESRFGFKLFMRVFNIALAYHSDRSLGASSFSFDSVNGRTLEAAKPQLPKILDATRRALENVAVAVTDTLRCDDLRMLPDASSLWPVFQLLIGFPQVAEARATIANLVFRLMTADLSNRELLALCRAINAAPDVTAALAVCDEHPDLRPSAIEGVISSTLEDARTVNSRPTLMLYWLVRGRSATDFSYAENQVADLAALRQKYPVEAVLSKAVSPQKQHIVPFSRLKALYGDASRFGRHEVNDIGNFTYISTKLNCGSAGMGSACRTSRPSPLRTSTPTCSRSRPDSCCATTIAPAIQRTTKPPVPRAEAFCGMRRDLIADAIASAAVIWRQQESPSRLSNWPRQCGC